MKGNVIFFFILVCISIQMPLMADNYYNKTIIANPHVYSLAYEAIEDLKMNMNQSTGQQFQINNDDKTMLGIHLILLSAQDEEQPGLRKISRSNPDAAWLQSNGNGVLNIYAYYKQGLINGIYTYLDTLGFKWYHPGDAWAIIPHHSNIEIKLDLVLHPDFVMRNFFGTYGGPRCGAIDKNEMVTKGWLKWYMRNRLGGSYALRGHGGNEFMQRNHDVFIAHPEYTALVDGQRVGYETASKLCISNKELQKLFVDDMVAQLRKDINLYPGNNVHCITAEPSDGGGDCTCESCKKLGSVSNRVFLLANLAAKEFAKIAPNAYVNLYAYNTHAAPPDFDLEPNVLVQIIPYGYQDYTSAENMMSQWSKRCKKLFLYDYYGLPIGNLDMPLKYDHAERLAEKVKQWQKNNIIGVTLESSYSIGSTGLGLYLFSKLSWNSHANIESLLNDYYKNCYGKLAQDMNRIRKELENDTMDRSIALVYAMQDLEKNVCSQKMTPEVMDRVNLVKVYMIYLKYLYNFKFGGDYNKGIQNADSLMRFVYSTFNTHMVHNYPVTEYLLHNIGDARVKKYTLEHYNVYKSTDPEQEFKNLKPYTSTEIDALFSHTLSRFPILSEVKKSKAQYTLHSEEYKFHGGTHYTFNMKGENYFAINTKYNSVFKFKYTCPSMNKNDTVLTLFIHLNGKSVYKKSYLFQKDSLGDKIDLGPQSIYDITFKCKNFVHVTVPNDLDMYIHPTKRGECFADALWTYIPEDVTDVYLTTGENSSCLFFNDRAEYFYPQQIVGGLFKIKSSSLPIDRILGIRTGDLRDVRYLNIDSRLFMSRALKPIKL